MSVPVAELSIRPTGPRQPQPYYLIAFGQPSVGAERMSSKRPTMAAAYMWATCTKSDGQGGGCGGVLCIGRLHDDAERAMRELDGRHMLGRPLKITPGVAKSQERIQNPPYPIRIGRWPPQEKSSFAKAKLETFFEGFKVEKVSKVFTPHPAKRFDDFDPGDHYYLFVDVDTPEDANRAMRTLNERAPGAMGSPFTGIICSWP
ncbi:Nucleotide-binding alpha-beta plait [Penicillium sp. DV-2018c]|nr:Nucleotide-binding alpha-beta plait [Penicillium sp. DV-2018c]KAJ5570649.1 Nucleotide-binding alpha-beta plait [Penicillium sp. DV-2018c]